MITRKEGEAGCRKDLGKVNTISDRRNLEAQEEWE